MMRGLWFVTAVLLGAFVDAQQSPIRINAGDTQPYRDTNGNVWSADQYYNEGKTFSGLFWIYDTQDRDLYRSNRYADDSTKENLTYDIPIENGTYQLKLHFAELYTGAMSKKSRVFDVTIEGDEVFKKVDVYAEVGRGYTALIKETTTQVNDGSLTIEFINRVENALISAIEVIPIGGSLADSKPTKPPKRPKYSINLDFLTKPPVKTKPTPGPTPESLTPETNTEGGIAIWARSQRAYMYYSTYDGNEFSSPILGPNIQFRWSHIRGATAPSREEMIVVGVTDEPPIRAGGSDSGGGIRRGDNTITAAMRSGEEWRRISIDGVGSTLGDVSEPFWNNAQVTYESLSGDALLIWHDDRRLLYSKWNGDRWTKAAAISGVKGEPQWFDIASNPRTNEIVVALSDSSNHNYVLVWDGSRWIVGPLQISTGSHQAGIAVAYESQSGRAMVVYGADYKSSRARYRIWDGTNWSSEASLVSPLGSSLVRWAVLRSDPNSDRLVLGIHGQGGIWLSVWDGTTWEKSSTIAVATSAVTSTQSVMYVGIESMSGNAIAVYREGRTLRYRTMKSGSARWSTGQLVANYHESPTAMTLDAEPGSNRISLLVQDDDADLHSVFWHGDEQRWGSVHALEGDTGEWKNQPFVYLWKAHPSSVRVVAETPAPSSSPSDASTFSLSDAPISNPSNDPTDSPTFAPSVEDTLDPTFHPSESPSLSDTLNPSSAPSITVSTMPSEVLSGAPTSTITGRPSLDPSAIPSKSPSMMPSRAFEPIYINAGGESFTDIEGNVWQADAFYNSGATSKISKDQVIAGAIDSRLFQTERWDSSFSKMLMYEIPVPDGEYEVTLYFSENFEKLQKPMGRVFDVAMEDNVVFRDLDVFSESGGPFTALKKTVAVVVIDGSLSIKFLKDVQRPKVSGIEIHSISTTAPSELGSSQPTFTPSSEPTIRPKDTTSLVPSSEPSDTQKPSRDPTISQAPPTGTLKPKFSPSSSPSLQESSAPSSSPTTSTKQTTDAPTSDAQAGTLSPTAEKQTTQPSQEETLSPTMDPSSHPTSVPSLIRTVAQSSRPSVDPGSPTRMPSQSPSSIPTKTISLSPSSFPSERLTEEPIFSPTASPSLETESPVSPLTSAPTSEALAATPPPTIEQQTGKTSMIPSEVPTFAPPVAKSLLPSVDVVDIGNPTRLPSQTPSLDPSSPVLDAPSTSPTTQATDSPTSRPTSVPTNEQSQQPGKEVSNAPSSERVSNNPSLDATSPPIVESPPPTVQPTLEFEPTLRPTTEFSTEIPSEDGSGNPSSKPSIAPSSLPTVTASERPSVTAGNPTDAPSQSPSTEPTTSASDVPSTFPSIIPTKAPSSSPLERTSEPTFESNAGTVPPTISRTVSPSPEDDITSGRSSLSPTTSTTEDPTTTLSQSPSVKSGNPTQVPSQSPSATPSLETTTSPSRGPSSFPSSDTLPPTLKFPTDQPSQEEAFDPTLPPSSNPTTSPSQQPTIVPTVSKSLLPSVENGNPKSTPSESPSGAPSLIPTKSEALAEPTSQSQASSPLPTLESQSEQPSNEETKSPSMVPSMARSEEPSDNPTSTVSSSSPSSSPTVTASDSPSVTPDSPPERPSDISTKSPTTQPTLSPSVIESLSPSVDPGIPTQLPSIAPSTAPTNVVSASPSMDPTEGASDESPTFTPTAFPTVISAEPSTTTPSFNPTPESEAPTVSMQSEPPSSSPVQSASGNTELPSSQALFKSLAPSVVPTEVISDSPSWPPSDQPSISPTNSGTTELPTTFPSREATEGPTVTPTLASSAFPSTLPSMNLTSASPSEVTARPSAESTTQPSTKPSSEPSSETTEEPSSGPSLNPTILTTPEPSSFPSHQESEAPSLSSDDTDAPSSGPSSPPSRAQTSRPSTEPTVIASTRRPVAFEDFEPIRINAGGEAFTDSEGLFWGADQSTDDGEVFKTEELVNGTSSQELFQTGRASAGGDLEYEIDVPNGEYLVSLYFVDIFPETHQIGARVFDVFIEGFGEIKDIDVFSEAGKFVLLKKQAPVSVFDGELEIEFESVVNDPIISAIEIEALGTAAPRQAHAVAGGPYFAIVPQGETVVNVTIDGSFSHSHGPNAEVISFKWYLDGEAVGTEAILTLELPVGTYEAVLDIIDSDNSRSTDNTTITVERPPLPEIVSLKPDTVNVAGGGILEITGSGFTASASATTVLIGTQELTGPSEITIVDDSTIMVKAIPPASAGSVDVIVETPIGISNVGTLTYIEGTPIAFDSATVLDGIIGPTCIATAPNGNIYVGTQTGLIIMIDLNDEYEAISKRTSFAIVASSDEFRSILGIAFDPMDTSDNPAVYVSHSTLFHGLLKSYNGKVSKVSGPNLEVAEDIITGLPVSDLDHGVNGLEFGDNGELYILVGANTNAGVPGPLSSTGRQKDGYFSGATLVAHLSRPEFDGDVTYDENEDPISGFDVEIFASGQRNPYDLTLHSNGFLYGTDNGANFGFGRRSVTCETDTIDPNEDDELNLIEQGKYYGQANRKRGETDPRQCTWRAQTEESDDEYTAPIALLPSSVNGVIEFQSDHFDGKLRGNLILSKFKGGLFQIELSNDGRSAVNKTATLLDENGGLTLTQGPDGTLFVAKNDDGKVIFVSPKEPESDGLAIKSVFPRRGPQDGGSLLQVYGKNLEEFGAPAVTVGGKDCPVLGRTRRDSSFSCRLPSGTGTVDIVVTAGSQSATFARGYRYISGTEER